MNPKTPDQTPETRTRGGGATASLGAQLRDAREAQGVTLRQISEQTRIQMRYLEAIETDNFEELPGGIFNRSFVKAYARQVSFSEGDAVEAYNRVAREQGAPIDEEMPTSYKPRVYTNGDSSRSPWLNLLFAALIVGIISIGAYALQHWYTRTASGTPVAANVAPTVAPTVAQATPTVNPQVLTVVVKAVRENVWLRVQSDDAAPSQMELKPADAAQEYTPQSRLRFQYAASKATALEVTINGRRARVPPNSKELVITPDSYEQLLQ